MRRGARAQNFLVQKTSHTIPTEALQVMFVFAEMKLNFSLNLLQLEYYCKNVGQFQCNFRHYKHNFKLLQIYFKCKGPKINLMKKLPP